jgi:cell division protein FtsI (penicillin-binding protein 3)
MRALLRAVVTEGTASFGEVDGYMVGGKTGSAEMPRPVAAAITRTATSTPSPPSFRPTRRNTC